MSESAEHDKSDAHPATVWSWIREEVVPRVLLACVLGGLTGVFTERQTITDASLVLAVATMLVFFLILALEFRADMRHRREHPQTEESE